MLKFYLKVLKIFNLISYFSNHTTCIYIQIAAMEDVHPKLYPVPCFPLFIQNYIQYHVFIPLPRPPPPPYSHFCSKNINVFEKTLATTVSKFVINKLVKLIYVIPPDHEIISMVILPFRCQIKEEKTSG